MYLTAMKKDAMSDYFFVYVTVGNATEAKAIGRAVVTERLAACANIIDHMDSIYHWEGRIEDAHEAILILKTKAALLDKLIERVTALHSYSCPCVSALPIIAANPAYLAWIDKETI